MPTAADLAGKQHDKIHIDDEWLMFERTVLKQRPVISGTADQIRRAYGATSDLMAAQYPAASDYPVREFTTYTDAGIALRVYLPIATLPHDRLPVAIFAHGGGNVAGGVWASSFEDKMCRFIVANAGIVVVQHEFRLAPEHQAPAQVNDTYDVFLWCHANASRLSGDPTRFLCISSSVGGSSALGAALMLVDRGHGAKNTGIVAIGPATMHPRNVPKHLQQYYTAYEQTWTGVPLQDGDSMLVFYAQNGFTAEQDNPYVVPGIHPRLHDLPPTYLLACGCDPVRDDATIVYETLRAHGRETHLSMYEGMPHFFWMFPALSKSKPFHDDVVAGVKWVLERAGKQ